MFDVYIIHVSYGVKGSFRLPHLPRIGEHVVLKANGVVYHVKKITHPLYSPHIDPIVMEIEG